MERRWGRPHPATAAVRHAVRAVLAGLPPDALVLVACSGGADSLALAAATAFEAPAAGLRAGGIVVDHGLQEGSAEVAAGAAETLRALSLEPVDLVAVRVAGAGEGLEAAARSARYAALDAAADRHGAAVVLLGHTLDDQAEQVLLGLVRGAGARSLAGMPAARGRYRRPLLGVTRAQARASAAAEGLAWWDDPMNDDPAFTRVRARRALADLERDLGPGVATALARTASQLRDDADHLDALADAAVTALAPGPWSVEAVAALPRAVRTRVWRRLLVAAGAPAGQVTARHTDACDRLLTAWHGQGAVHAPGGLRVRRSGGRVSIGPPALVE
ncbi:tRNA lysidine(34) synthetase TilS [Fodinibacter luteus]|uniref:tRNA(Ile)-lysidine synthase n=1 Tax=Fodinibacter luteus TaxID=552064 RepID=A0ABP8KQR8_9MICO